MSFDELDTAWRATLPEAEAKEEPKAEDKKVESPT